MATSLKINVIYSSILTTANYIFPLFTYPYVSRVLGVTNIGTVNFIDGIIRYFLLFAMMGINIVGIREIAVCKNNPEKLRSTFNSLFVLNGIFTLLSLSVLIICWFTLPQLKAQPELMPYGAIWLSLSFLTIEWFYKGMEDFRYVTTRTVTVKTLYVIAVFIFVRHACQYATYFLLGVLMIVVNAVINLIHVRKYTYISFRNLEMKRHLKPVLRMGVYMMLSSLYTSFNVAFLGFSSGDTQVGYYTTSTKLFTIILALFSAFTGVMLPRMSALIGEGKMDDFKNLILKSTGILFAFSIPVIMLVEIMAPQLVMLISGPGYEGAIQPLRFIMPLMCIIGYEQILIIQTMIPLKEDKMILTNSFIAGIIAVSLNFLIVPHLQSVGSAIVWISCETFLLIASAICVYRIIGLGFPVKSLVKTILVNLPLIVIFHYTARFVEGYFFQLLTAGIIMAAYVMLTQYYILRNKAVVSAINGFARKLLRK